MLKPISYTSHIA